MKKILLADDSITIQKVVELTFSDGDYQVVCVSNGAQALRRIPEFRPDVVLLDVVMPEKNGYEVCEQIRKDPATAGIPVLLLTGTFEPFDQRRADAVGASGHLTKPFESHSLVALVDELISFQPSAPLDPPDDAPLSPAAAAGPEPAGTAGAAREQTRPWTAPELPPPYLAGPEPADETFPPLPPGPVTDPADGGSYRAADHLALGDPGMEIIPDRFDQQDAALTATVRVSRGDVLPPPPGSDAFPAAGDEARADRPAPMEGFVAGYGFPEGAAPGRPERPYPGARGETRSYSFTPAPDRDDPAPPAEDPHAPRRAVDGRSAALTAEDIDRIAEQVVARISDRVLREIAWEVIPQVAEVIVRNRIRELEEQGDA